MKTKIPIQIEERPAYIFGDIKTIKALKKTFRTKERPAYIFGNKKTPIAPGEIDIRPKGAGMSMRESNVFYLTTRLSFIINESNNKKREHLVELFKFIVENIWIVYRNKGAITYRIQNEKKLSKTAKDEINNKMSLYLKEDVLSQTINEILNGAIEVDKKDRLYQTYDLEILEEMSNRLSEENKRLLDFQKELIKKEKELQKGLDKLKKAESKKLTQIAMHGVSQFFGDNKQLSLFSDERIDAFSRATGLTLNNKPTNYGVVLNQAQERVLYGILKAFSDTNYKGDELKDKGKALGDVYSFNQTSRETLVINENAPYKNIDAIPVVKLTQAEIIELSGHDRTQGDKQDVIEALTFLATKQFCFYWLRTKNEKGKIVKEKNGDYLKEEVMEVGTVLRVKYVKEEGTDKLNYYEISPSAPLLDQVNNHFLLVPNNWREEVKQITGNRASSYTYKLLLWLRREYERIRKYNKNGGKSRKPKPFKVSISWEEMSIALKMPESMYKANRKRAIKIIQEAYSVAQELGYLVKIENNGATDILYLNESYYPKPGELV